MQSTSWADTSGYVHTVNRMTVGFCQGYITELSEDDAQGLNAIIREAGPSCQKFDHDRRIYWMDDDHAFQVTLVFR